LWATRSTKGTMKFRPGASVLLYLPRRSTTQAFCCGTTLTERAMKITATTNTTIATSMGTPFVFKCRRAAWSYFFDDQAVA